jgi:hypothetical protein
MIQYPLNISKTNLYTTGKEYILNGKPYIGYYNQVANFYYTGNTQTSSSQQLIPLSEYIGQKQINKSLFDPTKLYIIKKINENIIRNVGINEYNNVQGNPTYKSIIVDSTNSNSISDAIKQFPEISNLIDASSTINNINNIFNF